MHTCIFNSRITLLLSNEIVSNWDEVFWERQFPIYTIFLALQNRTLDEASRVHLCLFLDIAHRRGPCCTLFLIGQRWRTSEALDWNQTIIARAHISIMWKSDTMSKSSQASRNFPISCLSSCIGPSKYPGRIYSGTWTPIQKWLA